VLLPGRYALQTELSHEVPDCVYLALAAREGAALSTADGRLARVARRRSVCALGVAPWEPADLPHRRATPRAAVLLVPHDQRASVVD